MASRLQERYTKEVAPALMKELEIKNFMAVPRLAEEHPFFLLRAEPFSYAKNRYRRLTPAISGRATAARSDAV